MKDNSIVTVNRNQKVQDTTSYRPLNPSPKTNKICKSYDRKGNQVTCMKKAKYIKIKFFMKGPNVP